MTDSDHEHDSGAIVKRDGVDSDSSGMARERLAELPSPSGARAGAGEPQWRVTDEPKTLAGREAARPPALQPVTPDPHTPVSPAGTGDGSGSPTAPPVGELGSPSPRMSQSPLATSPVQALEVVVQPHAELAVEVAEAGTPQPSPTEASLPTHIYIFQDAQNVAFPSDPALCGFTLYELVIKLCVEALVGHVLGKTPAIAVDWQIALPQSCVEGAPHAPSKHTWRDLDRCLGVSFIEPGDKRGSVDTKLMDRISTMLRFNSDLPASSIAQRLVVIMSGDDDFARPMADLRNAGFPVVLLPNGACRPSMKRRADAVVEMPWMHIVERARDQERVKDLSPTNSAKISRDAEAPRRTSAGVTSSGGEADNGELGERLLQVVRDAGADGILGAQISTAYFDANGEDLRGVLGGRKLCDVMKSVRGVCQFRTHGSDVVWGLEEGEGLIRSRLYHILAGLTGSVLGCQLGSMYTQQYGSKLTTELKGTGKSLTDVARSMEGVVVDTSGHDVRLSLRAAHAV